MDILQGLKREIIGPIEEGPDMYDGPRVVSRQDVGESLLRAGVNSSEELVELMSAAALQGENPEFLVISLCI